MEKKGLRVNARKTKIMCCRLRILESIHVVFAGREFATTHSFVWSVVGGLTKDVVVFWES